MTRCVDRPSGIRGCGKTASRLVPHADAVGDRDPDSVVVMYARAVDEAAAHLRDLEHAVREDLALAALALGLAVAATRSWPSLAMPLFLGGLGLGILGMRALLRHWDLLERLVGERDAYVIPEVRRYASREASMGRRNSLAAQLRAVLEQPRLSRELRSVDVTAELDALVAQLVDDELLLEPRSAVVCRRLLVESTESPLFDPSTRSAELRARVRDVQSGFGPRPHAP